MRNNKFSKNYKREIFLESLDNLIKASSRIGLGKDRAKNVKDILGWAMDITKRHTNGKM